MLERGKEATGASGPRWKDASNVCKIEVGGTFICLLPFTVLFGHHSEEFMSPYVCQGK